MPRPEPRTISRYSEQFGADPQAKITKQHGGNARISTFFANAVVSTQESRTYSITSRQMLHALWKQLGADYQEFEGFENYKRTRLVWMSGDLTLGEWRKAGAQDLGHEFFQLKRGEERTVFLPNETYFSAGFARMLTALEVLKVNIGIPVVCSARVMRHADQAKNFVACPYVIIERGWGNDG